MVKKVAVIGGTGAQGTAVIKALLEGDAYSVRVLTRNPSDPRAQHLLSLGKPGAVELVKGDGLSDAAILKVYEGAELAFVNYDTFTIGEKAEVFWGIRSYELAIRSKIKHYIWSNLESLQQLSGYDPKFRVAHYDAKSRVAQWISSIPKSPDNITSYSFLTSCIYMDNLFDAIKPVEQPDGSFVFYNPIGDGQVPLIALDDLGFYTRWIFDNPDQSSSLDLQIATQHATFHEIAATAAKVIGKPVRYEYIPADKFFTSHLKLPADMPLAAGEPDGITYVENFTNFWNTYNSGIIKKPYEFLFKIHPNHLTLESWMIKYKYDGRQRPILKLHDGKKA